MHPVISLFFSVWSTGYTVSQCSGLTFVDLDGEQNALCFSFVCKIKLRQVGKVQVSGMSRWLRFLQCQLLLHCLLSLSACLWPPIMFLTTSWLRSKNLSLVTTLILCVRTQWKDNCLWARLSTKLEVGHTRHWICQCLDLGLSASRTMRNKYLLFIIHTVCDVWLQRPKQSETSYFSGFQSVVTVVSLTAQSCQESCIVSHHSPAQAWHLFSVRAITERARYVCYLGFSVNF